MSWYSQNDPRWQNNRLGLADGITIGNDGCYVTALTNMANDCGHDIDVATLDQNFTDRAGNGGYVDQCECWDGMLSEVFPDIVYQGAQNYPAGTAADLSQLNNDVHVKQILEVDGQPNAPGLQTHFVYFYDYLDGVVRVIDSWTGLLINLADVYGNPTDCIYKIVTYTWTPPVPAPTPPPPVDPAPVLPPPHTDPVEPTPAPEAPVADVPAPEVPVDPVEAPVTPEPPQISVTPVVVDPPIAPEAPIDAFLSWLFKIISFWVKKVGR